MSADLPELDDAQKALARALYYRHPATRAIREAMREGIAIGRAATEDAKDANAESEQWVYIHGDYDVSDLGRVRCGKRTLIPVKRGNYLSVGLWINGTREERHVHRLVAQAFCQPESDAQDQVNHRDGNPLNNRADNLEWCTAGENAIHANRVIFAQRLRPVVGTNVKTGEEIRFASLAEASECGFIHANIQKVIAGKRKQHGGYVWRDATPEHVDGALGIAASNWQG